MNGQGSINSKSPVVENHNLLVLFEICKLQFKLKKYVGIILTKIPRLIKNFIKTDTSPLLTMHRVLVYHLIFLQCIIMYFGIIFLKKKKKKKKGTKKIKNSSDLFVIAQLVKALG